MTQLAIGVVCAAMVAFAAYRARALSASGACAAFAVGAASFGAGGWQAALVLFAFFVPSTILSRAGKKRKRTLVDIGKQGARDAWQVLANGGVAAIAILLALRFGAAYAAAFAGAFAAAAADTFGTEIGTLARGKPHSILTGQPLEAGLSGGVTLQGTLAEAGGAVFVATAAALLRVAPFAAVAIAGIAGATIDSLLGASFQSLRHCPACARDCETNPHVCGSATVVRRGIAWIGNDAVNLAATLGGAAVAYFLAYFFSR